MLKSRAAGRKIVAGTPVVVDANGIHSAALAYSALLGSTAAVGSILAVERPRYRAAALGAGLFLASDIVLAIQSFRGPFPLDTDLCWALYGPGQMLMVYGTAWAEAGTGLIPG